MIVVDVEEWEDEAAVRVLSEEVRTRIVQEYPLVYFKRLSFLIRHGTQIINSKYHNNIN